MREIEIKVRVQDKQVLLERLRKSDISLGEPVKQHDVVYGIPSQKRNGQPANWLRIRTENDTKVIFTLKRNMSGQLDSIEHEVTVDDEKEMQAIIELLGYELYSDIVKIRQKAKLGDIELCVDEVPGLGVFLEAEKLVEHNAEGDNVVDELWELCNTLGLSKNDEVHDGYDVMARKLEGAIEF